MTEQTFYARPDTAIGRIGAVNLRPVEDQPAVELIFRSNSDALCFAPHDGMPKADHVVLVDGVERHFWVEFTAPLRGRRDLRAVNGHDLRRKDVRVITTDDGRRYAFLADPEIPRDVAEAIPPGRRRTLIIHHPEAAA